MMKRWTAAIGWMGVMTAFVAAREAPAADSAAPPGRPNFLFILGDDLGREWLSCYGSETHRTPSIDRLAAGGTRFENAWATPLCTPTRHAMLTGRFPFRTGWTIHNDVPRWGGPCLDPGREVCLARSLREAGYATAIAGKWQLNDFRRTPDVLREHGFDEHCVWPGFETGNPPSAERYFDPFVQTNGKRETHKGKFGPDIFRSFLIDFMTRHKDGPFFAYYPMVLPHPPMTRTPHNLQTSAAGAGLQAGMVDYVDFEVGELVATLARLGIDRNTVVVFATDNGSPGLKARMRGLEVTGGKTRLTETGICVPLIVSCPGRVRGGVSEELVSFVDLFPTFMEMAGAKTPPNNTLDGRSFASLVSGDGHGYTPRPYNYSQLGNDRVVRDRRYKLWSSGKFYDLQADPLEQQDLSASSDPAVKAARERLQAVLNSIPADAKLPFNVPKGGE